MCVCGMFLCVNWTLCTFCLCYFKAVRVNQDDYNEPCRPEAQLSWKSVLLKRLCQYISTPTCHSEFSPCWWTLSALVVTEGWPGWVALGHWLKKNIKLQKSWPVIHNGRWLWRVGSIYNSFDSRDDGQSQTGGRNIAHILYSRLQYLDRSI